MEATKLIPLNWEMMKNGSNWIIVLLMFILAMLIIEIVMQYFNINLNNINNGVKNG